MTWVRVKITVSQEEYQNDGTTLTEEKTMVRVRGHAANKMALILWKKVAEKLHPDYKLEQINHHTYRQNIPLDNGTDKVIEVEVMCNNHDRRYLIATAFDDIKRREFGR